MLTNGVYSIESKTLSGIRGFLSFKVFMGHIVQIFFFEQPDKLAMFCGDWSVKIFFVISGYLITRNIQNNIQKNDGFNLKSFAKSRINRILPVFLMSVVVVSILSLILIHSGHSVVSLSPSDRYEYVAHPIQQLTAISTFFLRGDITGNTLNGPLWTLQYEIEFYVLAALIAMILTKKNRVLSSILLVIAGIIVLRHNFALMPFIYFGIGHVLYACNFQIPKILIFENLDWLGRMSYTLYALHFPILLAYYFMYGNDIKIVVLSAIFTFILCRILSVIETKKLLA